LKDPEQIWSIIPAGMLIVGSLFFATAVTAHLAWPVVSNGSITVP
jgi:hypothetical protein